MTEGEREVFEERAAILEFDGGLSREEAEKAAARQQETAWRWRVTFPDHVVQVAAIPEMTRDEVLARYPGATAEHFVPDIRPPSAPLATEEEAAIRAWLVLIGEDDPAIVAGVIKDCRRDQVAREFFIKQSKQENGHGEQTQN